MLLDLLDTLTLYCQVLMRIIKNSQPRFGHVLYLMVGLLGCYIPLLRIGFFRHKLVLWTLMGHMLVYNLQDV